MPTEDEILEAQFIKELEAWDQIQVDIGTVSIQGGQVKISMRIDVLTELLIEKGVITAEEANRKMWEVALTVLPPMREEITPIVQEAKLNAIKNGRKLN